MLGILSLETRDNYSFQAFDVAYVLYGRPRFPGAVPFVPLSCADLPRSSCVKFFVNEGAITIQKVKFSYKPIREKGLVDQFHKDNLCLH